MRVFLNTRIVPESRAKISVYDQGFLYGDGVFETFRTYHGIIFRVDQHLARLKESARLIRLRLPHPPDRLRAILYKTLAANKQKEALLRMTLSRGVRKWGLDQDSKTNPTLVVMVRPFSGYSDRTYRTGQKAIISSIRKQGEDSLSPQIKSTNYLSNRLAKMEALDKGANEAVMLNSEGFLTEGTVSNLFLVRNGRLLTPSLRAGILMGVTRQVVLELAELLAISGVETMLTPDDFKTADECFLTNTSMEIMPLRAIGEVPIGNGKPGEMTKKLRREFRRLVQRECRP